MSSASLVNALLQAPGLVREPPARSHLVQFYEDEAFLYRAVGDYLGAGLAAGESLIVIATEEHWRAFAARLAAAGHDVDEVRAAGQLTVLDARQTLDQFMVAGMPDENLFFEQVGGVVARLCAQSCHGPVRAYGEMVDLLWREGHSAAAIRLEELWNDLGRRHSFTLLCAYVMSNFSGESHREPFAAVCDAHSHVLPVALDGREPPALLREVSLLQQRARALENELAHRRELEEALREALAQRRLAEEQLRLHNQELSRTVRLSEMFVGILGHDLRNPLSAITTAASLLMRRADSERVGRPAARIYNSGQRMSRMIDQILDFTRIRLGQGLPLLRAQVDLAEICRSAIDEVSPAAEGSRVEIETAGELGGCWDGDRLAQLLSNLLGNALQHGDRQAPVSIRLDGRTPDAVVLEAHNAGAIPAEVMPTLFEPTRPGTHVKREGSSGLGMGLYISQQIVVAHGGTIEVSSSAEAGTRFTVRLPRAALT
jgi:signal transduction histidine kinase